MKYFIKGWLFIPGAPTSGLVVYESWPLLRYLFLVHQSIERLLGLGEEPMNTAPSVTSFLTLSAKLLYALQFHKQLSCDPPLSN